MSITMREKQEAWEHEYLNPNASYSDQSMGRDMDEEQCDLRTVYQRDRDRILHSKAFRRLKAKTQVFLAPEGDHYRTRLTHTLEVSQNARTIARALRYNEDLTEAIALGHDLGHTPFGHAGERALNSVCPNGFKHNEQSIRVVEILEKNGAGLNLTKEVRDGILNHQSIGHPATMEGKIVQLSDKIAYINHDIDDAIRGEIIKETDIPAIYRDILGGSTRARINTMIHDVVEHSEAYGDIGMSDEIRKATLGLRAYMFENVYKNSKCKSEEGKAISMLLQLYHYYINDYSSLPDEFINMIKKGEGVETVVCDYIAGMTDTYSLMKFQQLFEPQIWHKY